MLFTIIVLTALTGLFALLESLGDAYAILNGTYSRRQRLSHLYEWLSRALAVGVSIGVLFGFTPALWVMLPYAGIIFWLVFEYAVNWKLGRAPDAVGQNAWTDIQIRRYAQALALTPEFLKRILYFAALTIAFALALLVTGCQRPPQPSADLVALPVELQALPIGASSMLPDGFFYTRITDSSAVRTVQPVAAKKIKIKNVGNVDVGKKATVVTGEGNNLDNSMTKDKSKVKADGPIVVGDNNNVPPPAKRTGTQWFVWAVVAVVAGAGILFALKKIL